MWRRSIPVVLVLSPSRACTSRSFLRPGCSSFSSILWASLLFFQSMLLLCIGHSDIGSVAYNQIQTLNWYRRDIMEEISCEFDGSGTWGWTSLESVCTPCQLMLLLWSYCWEKLLVTFHCGSLGTSYCCQRLDQKMNKGKSFYVISSVWGDRPEGNSQALGLVCVWFSAELRDNGKRWHYLVPSMQALNYKRNLWTHRMRERSLHFSETEWQVTERMKWSQFCVKGVVSYLRCVAREGTLLNSPPNSAKHLLSTREATSGERKVILTLSLRVDTRVLAFPVLRDLDNEEGIRPLAWLLPPLETYSLLLANPTRWNDNSKHFH